MGGGAGPRHCYFLVFVRHNKYIIPHSHLYLPLVFLLFLRHLPELEDGKLGGGSLDWGGLRYVLGRLCARPAGGFSMAWWAWCRGLVVGQELPDRCGM